MGSNPISGNALIAQLVLERGANNAKVSGSSPDESTFSLIAQLVERTAVNREVAGSSPAEGVTVISSWSREYQNNAGMPEWSKGLHSSCNSQ
jgi:hypothetical protein